MEGEKKDRPQNRNLKPLGSGLRTPEEELEIRRMGKRASDVARSRNASVRAAVRAMMNARMSGKKGQSLDIEKIKSLDDVNADNAPVLARLIMTKIQCALSGDPLAFEWLMKYLDDNAPVKSTTGAASADNGDTDALEHPGGVRIHLIRGDKPKEDISEEDAATRAANRLATIEAIKAAGAAAEKIGEEVVKALNTADGDPDE